MPLLLGKSALRRILSRSCLAIMKIDRKGRLPKMEERLYELEDKVQDLELEVLDLKQQVYKLKQQPEHTSSFLGGQFWVLIPVVAILSWMLIEIFD